MNCVFCIWQNNLWGLKEWTLVPPVVSEGWCVLWDDEGGVLQSQCQAMFFSDPLLGGTFKAFSDLSPDVLYWNTAHVTSIGHQAIKISPFPDHATFSMCLLCLGITSISLWKRLFLLLHAVLTCSPLWHVLQPQLLPSVLSSWYILSEKDRVLSMFLFKICI